MIELFTDPAAWVGLATLIVLEIVLGIDNLIFIAILTEKLPPHQRDRARITGLSCALFMRLALLSAISWLITLTTPLFSVFGHGFSGRDLILLLGGLFLLFKATRELHERLEGGTHQGPASAGYASFAVVIAQIIVLDAVFSLDSVITAVGMVDQLPVMMAAVVVSIGVMLVASKPLTRFVNAHPTVVVLCLSFLLMIGLSLVAEGLGFHLPKGYLYAAISFSIMIEAFNQLARRNRLKQDAHLPFRERTADAVLRLLSGPREQADTAPKHPAAPAFAPAERSMVSGVLNLAERSVRAIMTPRQEISWIDLTEPPARLREKLLDTPHSLFPVSRGTLDQVVGVARAKELLGDLTQRGAINPDHLHPPIYVQEATKAIDLIDVLRRARGQLVLVNDNAGKIQGLVSPIDLLEAIAGEFPDEDEVPEIQENGPKQWTVSGRTDLHQLEQTLLVRGLAPENGGSATLHDWIRTRLGRPPEQGERITDEQIEVQVLDMTGQQVTRAVVRLLDTPAPT